MTKRQLEELLHHESFLRFLARRLLRDAARADDVVQETWLAVLHSNKSPSEIHRGWLAGVLRNLARRKLREERRRTRREQLVARPHLTDAAPPTLDAEELRVRLAKLVLALPAHYSEALLLRYYEGLEPAQIAARTGVPASTVRTRIQRGLARIRGDLDGASCSVAPLLSLIATGRSSRPLRFGALAAAAAIVLVATLAVVRGTPPTPRTATRSALAGNAAPAPRHSGPATITALPGQPDSSAQSVPHAQTVYTLDGSITLPRGVADARAQIEVTAPPQTGSIRVFARDRFAVDLSPLIRAGGSMSLLLRVTHPECEEVLRRVPANARDLAIVMERRPLFAQELIAPAPSEPRTPGAPPELLGTPGPRSAAHTPLMLDAIVHLPDDVEPEPVTLAVCRDKRCLRFRIASGRRVRLDVGALLDDGATARLIVRAASHHTVAARRVIAVWEGPRLDPLRLVLERGSLASGRVTWVDGAAAKGVTVAAFLSETVERASAPLVTTTTDAQGAFEFAIPERGETILLAVAGGAAPIAAPASENTHLLLRPQAVLTGLVAHAPVASQATGPWPDARVRLSSATDRAGIDTGIGTGIGRIAWTASGPRWSALTTRTDARGAFRFAGLERDSYTVHAVGESREVRAPGHVEFVPRPLKLTVLTRGDGTPLANARVTVGDVTRTADDRGRTEFTVAGDTLLAIAAEAPGFTGVKTERRAAAEIILDLAPLSPTGGLLISVGVGGLPLLATARMTLAAMDRGTPPVARTLAIAKRALRVDAVDPGSYEVRVDLGGWHFPARFIVHIVAGEVARAHVQPETGGKIDAALLDRFGNKVAVDLFLTRTTQLKMIAQRTLSDAAGPVLTAMPPAHRADALLPPGRYQLWLLPRRPMADPRIAQVEVRAGERTRITVSE